MSTVPQNLPVYALPHLYIDGLNISVASTTVLAIAPGQARDILNHIDMPVGFQNLDGNVLPAVLFQGYQQPLLLNCATVGANGLDAGALAASTQYAIYLIGDSRQYLPTAGIVSLSSNAFPTLPFGYDSWRLLGFIETDGSEHFVYATHEPQLVKSGNGYYLSPPTSVLSGGNATTFTAIDCSTPVPTGALFNVILELLVTFIPAAAGDVAQFRPTGSSATTGLVTITGAVANVAQTQYVQVIAGSASTKCEIDYLVTASGDSLTVLVAGWYGSPHVAYPT
jgi:hypothetical protein